MEQIKIVEILNDTNDTDIIRIKIQSDKDEDKYIDTSLVNLLRRYIISNIDTYTFLYINKENNSKYLKPIQIEEGNINNINNDMLGHRISLLPINISTLQILVLYYRFINKNDINNFEITQDILDELKFYIQTQVETDEQVEDDYISITEEHIQNDLFKSLKTDTNFINHFKTNLFDEFKKIYYIDIDEIDDYIINLKLFNPFIYENEDYYNIITKIKKKTQKINISMYLRKNSVITDKDTEQNIRYSPVAACRSTFAIDYNKVLIEFKNKFNSNLNIDFNQYNQLYNNDDLYLLDNIPDTNIQDINNFKSFCIEEGERYFKGVNNQNERIHILEYQSIDFYNTKTILKLALESLNIQNKYNNIHILYKIGEDLSNIQELPNTNNLNKYLIQYSNKLENSIDILIKDGDHGIGYLIQTYINFIDKDKNFNIINYIGYKMVHPLSTELLITIQYKKDNLDYLANISALFKTTYNYLDDLINQLKMFN